ncbi:MAG: SlyX family protein [Gammaproteobacteria bacterium]|nr:SlyX family protein [Gammaproteobacteria bacterium]
MSDQITELQIMQMDHERSIESLSEQLHSQQSRIEQMEKQLEALIDHIRSLQESLPATESGNIPPPHY